MGRMLSLVDRQRRDLACATDEAVISLSEVARLTQSVAHPKAGEFAALFGLAQELHGSLDGDMPPAA